VSAGLQLRGTLGEPLAVGEVRLDGMTLAFPFASLEVKQGMVILSSENAHEPRLFVTATGRAFGYDIRLQVTGTAQDPIPEFSSVPPLTSEDILLMVTTGRIPRDDYRLSTGQRAQRLGVFVGRSIASKLGFGGGDRLSIRSGENISESGKETYSVEYKMTDDWSLIGEYDRFDEYNAGVKWRVFSR
jgi:translocation and assembly module TamB